MTSKKNKEEFGYLPKIKQKFKWKIKTENKQEMKSGVLPDPDTRIDFSVVGPITTTKLKDLRPSKNPEEDDHDRIIEAYRMKEEYISKKKKSKEQEKKQRKDFAKEIYNDETIEAYRVGEKQGMIAGIKKGKDEAFLFMVLLFILVVALILKLHYCGCL